jgi:hypothetical protein
MSQIGSFALLLALALSAYSFLAGLFALARPGAGSDRLGETARRAGIAVFAVVFLAALVLVISAFQDDFSIAYIGRYFCPRMDWCLGSAIGPTADSLPTPPSSSPPSRFSSYSC